MKKIFLALAVSLLGMSAHSKTANQDEISHCSGYLDDSFKVLNLDFYYTSPRVGSSMLLTIDNGDEVYASYSIVAIKGISFDQIAYELSFKGGFSLGEVRLIKGVITNEYEFLIYNGSSQEVIELSCY